MPVVRLEGNNRDYDLPDLGDMDEDDDVVVDKGEKRKGVDSEWK